MTATSPDPRLAELLRRRRAGRARPVVAGLASVRRAARPVLSYAQHRLWFLTKLLPDTPGYHVPVAYRLRGPLDVRALRVALHHLVAGHETLRTRFGEDEHGEPYQIIDPQPRVRLTTVDVSVDPEPMARAVEVARATENAPFDLERGPLLRCRLVRLAEDDHVLTMAVHHIVFDRASLTVLGTDLSRAYAAELAGTAPPSFGPSVPYAEYAQWQRQIIAGRRRTELVEHWVSRLAGAPPLLELPADRPRPAVPSHRAGTVAFTVPPDVVTGVRALAAGHRMTPFMVVLAAYQAVLGRHGARSDIVVGVPMDLRPQPELAGAIGFFVNSLPIRLDLSGDPSFAELLARARQGVLAAYDHREAPFELVVERLAPQRDLSHNPVMQVWFELADLAAGGPDLPRLPGVTVTHFESDTARTRFDLEAHLIAQPSGEVSGRLLYAVDLFEHDTVDAIARHLVNFLRSAVAAPDLPLSEIQIFDDAELRQLFDEWAVAPRLR
ncbi:MAG TPA: condensation domain-containing protein [Pseudonocardiaceae bacterium]|nr:condensation domain-containing protein [Pseudonocardiaceae bacterium]